MANDITKAQFTELKSEALFTVHIIGYDGRYTFVRLKAKRIVNDEKFITFFDYYGDVSGSFKNDVVLGYARQED